MDVCIFESILHISGTLLQSGAHRMKVLFRLLLLYIATS